MISPARPFSHDLDPTPESGSATVRPHHPRGGPEMAHREIGRWEIFEVLRRVAREERQRAIQRVTGHSRSRIRRGVRAARRLCKGALRLEVARGQIGLADEFSGVGDVALSSLGGRTIRRTHWRVRGHWADEQGLGPTGGG